ncbi:cytochrome C551 [Salipaludibacillus neizhouensis]|uniref:Cytochrome C551 n=1 Tax=Salipaludibacillus neizhouensis TaxID=885475 RepID=A0A3A9KDW4_9BACI|nr:cytochrome c [Salipaludibacillus neizhouensis]RKL68691.1 cytochrome C551 [Salipaludibacillus neizhouensis]
MRGKPLFPFALTAFLGIGLIIVLSFVGINQEDIASENGEGNENAAEEEFASPVELGENIFEGTCAGCHGGDLSGASGPPLNGGNLSHDDVLAAIAEGPGNMPDGLVAGEEADAVAEFIMAESE